MLLNQTLWSRERSAGMPGQAQRAALGSFFFFSLPKASICQVQRVSGKQEKGAGKEKWVKKIDVGKTSKEKPRLKCVFCDWLRLEGGEHPAWC